MKNVFKLVKITTGKNKKKNKSKLERLCNWEWYLFFK